MGKKLLAYKIKQQAKQIKHLQGVINDLYGAVHELQQKAATAPVEKPEPVGFKQSQEVQDEQSPN